MQLVDRSERQLVQLTESSAQRGGVSADLSRAVTAAISPATSAARTIATLDASIGEVVKLITGIASVAACRTGMSCAGSASGWV